MVLIGIAANAHIDSVMSAAASSPPRKLLALRDPAAVVAASANLTPDSVSNLPVDPPIKSAL